jgi:hypothetical protein
MSKRGSSKFWLPSIALKQAVKSIPTLFFSGTAATIGVIIAQVTASHSQLNVTIRRTVHHIHQL